LGNFVDTFEDYVIDAIADAVYQAEDDLKQKATKNPSWGTDVAEGLRVTVNEGDIVYTSQDSVSDRVADNEFGSSPSPLMRPTAIKHQKSMTKDLSEKISKAVPSA